MTEGRGERARETPDFTIHDPEDVIGGVTGGESGERATGTPNTIYDLSSVLFHALQGGASYDTYIEDAELEGDEELTEFFRRVREEDRDRASEARMLLAERTPTDARAEGTAPSVPVTEDLPPTVATTEGSEPNVSPGTEPPGGLPDIEPRAGRAYSGDPSREYAVTEMPDEDLNLTPPEDAVLPDAQGPPGGAPSRTEAGESPRTEPSDEFPGTEPVREDVAKESRREVLLPEEIPPERAGEIPTAEEVPPPRTQNVPGAEQVPSGTPPQASPGDVQGEQPSLRSEEATQAGQDASRQNEGDQEDKGLLDEIKDAILGEEERGREEADRPRRG